MKPSAALLVLVLVPAHRHRAHSSSSRSQSSTSPSVTPYVSTLIGDGMRVSGDKTSILSPLDRAKRPMLHPSQTHAARSC
jgi:hypothetical protein